MDHILVMPVGFAALLRATSGATLLRREQISDYSGAGRETV